MGRVERGRKWTGKEEREGKRMDERRGEGRGFSEVGNSNYEYALQCQFAPRSCQIWCRSVKLFRRYGRLLNFSRWRSSAILNFQKLEILTAHTLRRAKIHHHAKFVRIGQGVAETWPLFIFQDGSRPPSWICYTPVWTTHEVNFGGIYHLSLIHIWRCRRSYACRSRWSPYH